MQESYHTDHSREACAQELCHTDPTGKMLPTGRYFEIFQITDKPALKYLDREMRV